MKLFGEYKFNTLAALALTARADMDYEPHLRGLGSNNGNDNGNGNGNDDENVLEREKNPFRGRHPVIQSEVKGGRIKKAKMEDSGRPLSDMPKAQMISTIELETMEELPRTGLYLLDTDFIPEHLEDELALMELLWDEDGNLINKKGQASLLIVQSQTFEVEVDDPNAKEDAKYFEDEESEGSGVRRLASP